MKLFETCKINFDAAGSCAHHFLKYLLTRSFAANEQDKANSRRKSGLLISSTESEYRSILDNFMKDLLVLLDEVEWPGVEIALVIYGKLMVPLFCTVLFLAKTHTYIY